MLLHTHTHSHEHFEILVKATLQWQSNQNTRQFSKLGSIVSIRYFRFILMKHETARDINQQINNER